jgi:hypothetical protein
MSKIFISYFNRWQRYYWWFRFNLF